MSKTAKELLTEAGLQDSHWGRRIIAAEERGKFNSEDRNDSLKWTDCACGHQDPRIPRDCMGVPLDDGLSSLGASFHVRVESNRFDYAAYILIAIEKRAGEVLAEVLS